MSAKTENPRDTFAIQLATFDDKLHATNDDVDMLADIQEGIGSLLASTTSGEVDIRRILQERFDQGHLRKETFQLVNSMLDRFVTENVPTSPTAPLFTIRKAEKVAKPRPVKPPTVKDSPKSDDAFGTTTVIPVSDSPSNSADSRVQVGSVLRDRFLLQEKIPGGSMGVVYKALDRRLAEAGSSQQFVAIKILSPALAENGQALRALQQEATKGRCLIHPNIVRFVDLDRDDDLYFLVMEWLEGRTLADILDSKDRSIIDNHASFRIVRQIGDALDYAHRCGIVHADIKPGNIMITPSGDAKLFDFGVARVRHTHPESDFDPGVLEALTAAYSSMQVLTGEEPTASDDVFSLACLLYRLIAGYRVFGPRNAAEASEGGMAPQQLQALSDTQWRALKKALSYSRVARFTSVREFLDALEGNDDQIIAADRGDQFKVDESSGSGKVLWLLSVLAGILIAVGYQYGYLDSTIAGISNAAVSRSSGVELEPTALSNPSIDVAQPAIELPAVVEEIDISEVPLEEETIPQSEEVAVGPTSDLVDFSKLPPATIVVPVSILGRAAETIDIALREDGAPAIIDFVRDDDLSRPITLRLEEIGFSGNRSPWAAGQYAYSNSGIVEFPAGQRRSRVTLTMASDPLREADRQSTLRLREIDFPDSTLAILNLRLEDDDQRAFESQLPRNTIAFAVSQASIRETDPAVQIDVVRFNPDRSTIVAKFTINDITATEGEDYFAPGNYSIYFGPGQRSARLLIPLVQDTAVEGDEAFVIALTDQRASSAMDVYQRIVVMIRDDEPQIR